MDVNGVLHQCLGNQTPDSHCVLRLGDIEVPDYPDTTECTVDTKLQTLTGRGQDLVTRALIGYPELGISARFNLYDRLIVDFQPTEPITTHVAVEIGNLDGGLTVGPRLEDYWEPVLSHENVHDEDYNAIFTTSSKNQGTRGQKRKHSDDVPVQKRRKLTVQEFEILDTWSAYSFAKGLPDSDYEEDYDY